MIRSMTAFARLSAPASEGQWVVEIRSLNHRFFEFSLKLPPALGALEGRIRDFIQNQIRRGKVMVSISRDSSEDPSKGVVLNQDAVKVYLAGIQKLKKRFKIPGDLTVGDLLKLPGIFTVESSGEDPEKAWPSLQKVLGRVLERAVRGKMVEGKKLGADISNRLKDMTEAIGRIETHVQGREEKIFQKLSERVDQLLAEKEKDTDRVYREVAFLVERSDITEELVRMKSHLALFKERLDADGEAGRELDFLCQEMNREINTIGSKAQLFEVSQEAVFVKSELEKIREQVQNIE